MAISFQLDEALEQQLRRDFDDLDQAAKEALLIQAYRLGKLSIGGLARTLGMGVLEADQWLAERGIPLNYTADDLRQDLQTLGELRGSASQ